MKKQPTAWEPHPVSPERKAELRAAGYRILDERFKPADDPESPPEDAEQDRPARVRPRKQSD